MDKRIHLLAKKTGNQGFTVLEMVMAMAVLGIAALGGAAMINIGIHRNDSVRMDTTSANVAQTVVEAMASVQARNDTTVNIPDCAGNNMAVNTAVGGASLWGAGAPTGINPGDIDFTAVPVAGYQAIYLVCGPNGIQAPYDVRWRVDPIGAPDPATGKFFAKQITVAAQQQANQAGARMLFSPPVTLRSVVGN